MRVRNLLIIFIILIKIIFLEDIFCEDNFEKVINSLNTPEKIADWIKKNIKYVSKYGINDFNDPEKTFEIKEGNCAEMAKLTFYLLKKHGYNPYLMVIQLSSNDPKNHVVCIYITKNKKINKIDNGRLSTGYNSYKAIAAKHDQNWWRYILYDDYKNFDDNKSPIEETYQKESKKVVNKYIIDQKQISSFYQKVFKNKKNIDVKIISNQGKKYETLYYGDIDDFEFLKNINKAHSTGWTHLIYYQNNTEKKGIYSIIISGKSYGDLNNHFQFFLVNSKGETFYTSNEYSYNEFPKDNFKIKEYTVRIRKAPKEFMIVLKTFASRENGVSIQYIPSTGNKYSYRYQDLKNYVEFKDGNWAVFPKLY